MSEYMASIAAYTQKMTSAQNIIKADAKIVANSIDAELNARDANLHVRLAPDFSWLEFYCQNGWSAPSNTAIVTAPGYQDVLPRMGQAPGIVIPLLSSCHDCQHISFFWILTSDYLEYFVGNKAPEYSSNQAPEYSSNQAPEYSSNQAPEYSIGKN